ncbi:hypothetical protein RB195_022289 [Necator americanus]|uniref:Uncharacterized protein n=1 Tax=Necator americanus TaxID=51031 RepID=A0ABR1EEQ0_NECAM
MRRWDSNSNPMRYEKWYYPAERTSDNGHSLTDLCQQTDLIIASTFKGITQQIWGGTGFRVAQVEDEESQTSARLRSDEKHPSVEISQYRNTEYGFTRETKEFLFNRKSERQDAARETVPVLLPRKKLDFASAETKSTHNSVCVVRSTVDFSQKKAPEKEFASPTAEKNRESEWISRAKEVEKTWKDKILRKAEHFKTLLNRQATSALELNHVDRPTYAVKEKPPKESEVLVCI